MLVYNTVEHDARVRRSARALAEAGLEVIVLGIAPPGDPESRSWLGFELLLVPRRDGLVEREGRLRARSIEARERLDAAKRAVVELRGRSGPADRVRMKIARRRSRLAKAQYEQARAELEEARAAVRGRAATDPLGLAGYEETWWPHVERLRPDVVHVHDPHGLLVARRAALAGARWVYDAHEDPLKKGADREDRDVVLRDTFGDHLRHADAVVAVSPGLADRLTRAFDLPEMPTAVLNTPPLAGNAPAPSPGLRARAGVRPDTPLVVYSGSMTSRRRMAVVLEALERLPEVHLALVVSFTNKFVQETVALAGRMGITDRIHLVPKVPPEALVPFVAEADVGVHPLTVYPNSEIALPNKLFEYLHASLPLVVSDCPAMAEFVRHTGIGEVAAVDDPQAWADAIDRMLREPPFAGREEELEALKREWSWELRSEDLVAVYRRVLGPRFPETRAAPVGLRQ